MKSYKDERKFWLGKLKEMGVKAPAAMYSIETNDDHKEDQIDRMKAHMIELAQMQNYQQQEQR